MVYLIRLVTENGLKIDHHGTGEERREGEGGQEKEAVDRNPRRLVHSVLHGPANHHPVVPEHDAK